MRASDDLPYLVALHSIEGLGSGRLMALFQRFGSGKAIWDASLKDWGGLNIPDKVIGAVKQAKMRLVPEDYFQSLLHSKITPLILYDNEYPDQLKQITTPPFILYCKGHFPTLDKSIGIVGTRKVTGYGRSVTEQLTKDLVDSSFTIISGLARGVDTIAHQTCIKNNGKTVAVLAGGLNEIYPPENYKLAAQIEEQYGCLISEFPLNYPHLAGNFPARNRIISGLSDAVLVTEAAEDSGSLITARFAAEQGKDVFAVPGPITSSLAKGPLSLIKDGAKLVTSIDDILNELGIEKNLNSESADLRISELDEVSRQVIGLLVNESMHLDEISRELKLTSAQASAILIKLEIQGLVKNLGSGIYAKY